MAWWRRDPSLWARSPAHRYAQRVLRDHEALLRTRCFSRTPSNAAQHQDHDGGGRPEGMSDLEWTQLQHYMKWKKRLQEHPYKALFGASEDMLRGKGLTDWEWVYKTFPKWMLQEMDASEWADQGKNVDKNDHTGRRYGDGLGANVQEKLPSHEREPTFAQPAIKTTHYERDEFGIVSPSDLRRPKEASHVKVAGKHQGTTVLESNDTAGSHSERTKINCGLSGSALDSKDANRLMLSKSPVGLEDREVTAKEASDRESSFIDAFFAKDSSVYDRDSGNSKSWRQTALQRQNGSSIGARQKQRTFLALVDNYPYPKTGNSAAATQSIEKQPQLNEKKVGWSVPETIKDIQEVDAHKADSTFTRSTHSVLESLPKDDIDFLSAADIRAAMGTRKSSLKSSDEKKQTRQELETGYAEAKPEALDEVVEAHVVNNYYVRRTEQELERAQTALQESEVERVKAAQHTSQSPSEAVQIESSIDRMRRWIEEGGASLSKHFWQDPIEADVPSEADLQFAKQMAGLGKGRRAREHISDDLENGLPMCKGLLERLRNDENRVEHAVYLLRSHRKVIPGAEMSKNLRTIRERRLRNSYERTEKQFESACQSLRELDTTAVQKATNAFKRRLGIASRILHKNHTLTRMLTWSAQARLDEPDHGRGKTELYSEILTRLATLRDTQLALARLMGHAIQIYRVSLKPADEALSRSVTNREPEATETLTDLNSALSDKASAKSVTDTVAAAHLTDEIEIQKAAMQGLSDDGYARAPKQTLTKSFEEKNPLAHSLFRPFNLQLESLGNKTEGEEAADKLKEAFKQKTGDKKLVQEVRSACEDVYGPITVEHRQLSPIEDSVNAESRDEKAFEMRKDDPPIVTEITAEEAVTKPETALASITSETPKSEPSTTASAAATEVSIDETGASTVSTDSAPSISDTTSTDAVAQDGSIIDMPTHYTILVHDPQTDTLSITTSTSGPPRDTTTAVPIHQALSSLKFPAKFIPFITPGLEIVTAKRHMLVLRDALDSTSSTRGFETVSATSLADQTPEPFSSEVNPIDGTTRLSPTGYSGVEESQEQLERDFEERRQAAAATEAARSKKSKQQPRDDGVPKNKRRGAVGSVVKTAIWASAVCYVVGVTAEVLR
ncbi:hypothetical protein EJ07DRAFT_112921 [Lizonia empirigonia]|nr:hypothetical protein EJ07DRAFT_112921 [Lizonia empirigonia]